MLHPCGAFSGGFRGRAGGGVHTRPQTRTTPSRPPPPLFTVLLVGGPRPLLPQSSLDELAAECPTPPDSTGLDPPRLHFRRWADALDTLTFLWTRRLRGEHQFTPHVVSTLPVPSARAEEERKLLPLFLAHARGLLSCEPLQRQERRIDQLAGEISRISGNMARRPNRYRCWVEMQEKSKSLQAEKQIVESRVAEFQAAIRTILRRLGDDQKVDEKAEKEEASYVEVFNFDDEKELNWGKLHSLMTRECKRLDDGLPIYSSRQNILKAITNNQVVMLVGETGSGKSTQLVQFLADARLATNGSIVCTQPRKVAAISLAQRVGEESRGCYADKYVMSVSKYSSMGSTPKVLFMTDHCLLQHCIGNMSMSGISYVIIDEVHERSLNTDLILALIKKKLFERLDLGLIIMSATADTSKLVNYFYGCFTMHIKGRTFPVDIKYVPDVADEASDAFFIVDCKVGKCAPYVADVVKLVSLIHKKEKDGAILAFLTSQIEVQTACESLDDPSAVVLPMHGKLSCEEQNRVFLNYPGKRKIIFSTNVSETSLTIPGVKYVVDSGMAKDSKFEPSTGMNVLKVGKISQSSANQRAGRAGRTEAGKCFRLYSESDFQSMMAHQEPEIRKVHIGIAVLRILALGFRAIQDFDFVDAPCPKAIDAALLNLIRLGAIIRRNEEYELTDIGNQLIKLGLEPRLGKLILECCGCGLKKEGLVLTAVMANASSIFCRFGNEEEKSKSDCLKVPFCHQDGDLFTLLSVYKEWEDLDENKKKWCWENSINSKSLVRCQDTVFELENCLRQEFNIIIPSYWLWNPHKESVYDKLLKRVILSTLSENVAMHSGYDRIGYEVALTGQQLQLHPSCSLLVYGRKPNWVVFSEILSISNKYLVCVNAIDYDSLRMIQPPLFDVHYLESRKLQRNVVSGVCNAVLRRFCGKTNSSLRSIVSRVRKLCMDDRIAIDVDFDRREIQYFAPASAMENVSHLINNVVQCETKWLKDECIEKFLFPVRTVEPPSFALFGSGAEIKYLELENRFLTVEVSHRQVATLDDRELLMVIDQHAPGRAHFYRLSTSEQEVGNGDRWGKITYLNPEAAENAIDKLNKVEFCGSLLKVVSCRTSDYKMLPFPEICARVCWPRKPSRGVAFVSCSREDAILIAEECNNLEISGSYLNCEVSTKFMACVFVTGIPKDILDQELYDVLRNATSRKILSVRILRGEAVKSLSRAACEAELVKEIARFMPSKHISSQNLKVDLKVKVYDPKPNDSLMNAAITFNGSYHLEAAKALEYIQGKVLPGFLPWQRIHCEHLFYTCMSCPSYIYDVIKKQLGSLLDSFNHLKGVLSVKLENQNGSVRVKIRANATKIVADLRKPLEELMKGKPICHPSLTPTILSLLLTQDGINLMKVLGKKTESYFLYDRHKLNVRLFAPPEEAPKIEKILVQELLALHENKQLVHLRHGNLPPGLMKCVVQKFGHDLRGLKEMIPGVDLVLDTRRHIISVRGSKEHKQRVEDAIAEAAKSLDQACIPASEEASCPICLGEVEEPYNLESCGHVYCHKCLVDLFDFAIRSHEGFPLCCIKKECKSPLLLVDVRALLTIEKQEELFRSSLGAFVAASHGVYRFCPTPDCPAVYRVSSNETDSIAPVPFVCCACGAQTCTRCHMEYHQFISCERYKEFKEDPDQSLLEWRMGKNYVKDCPRCRLTIEKVEGCDHMQCHCGAHVCWTCLACFETSQDCYSHMRSSHETPYEF